MRHSDGKVVRFVAIAAVLFGIATLVAGTRALLGAGPGYVIYLPLLRFNTLMGVAYVAVGALAWRNARLAMHGAAVISLLNLLALGFIGYLYAPGGPVARESLQAMAFRTVVWVVFLAVLVWADRSARRTQ